MGQGRLLADAGGGWTVRMGGNGGFPRSCFRNHELTWSLLTTTYRLHCLKPATYETLSLDS